MAGRKGEVSRSLQFRLSLWLSLTIVLVAATAGFLSFSSAFDEAIELQDDQLRQTAALLQRQLLSAPPTEVAGPPGADPESRLIVLTAHPQGLEARGCGAGLAARSSGRPANRCHRERALAPLYEHARSAASGSPSVSKRRFATRSQTRVRYARWRPPEPDPPAAAAGRYLIRKMLQPLKTMAAELEFRSEPVWRKFPGRGSFRDPTLRRRHKAPPGAGRPVRRRAAAIPGGRGA